ncbi:MAG: (Fe-S)-binding protein, partial [Deltaproteobacteria bacterium]|nr:(Fe-S)-binding protein [Deltaproteobacteria bacterium]
KRFDQAGRCIKCGMCLAVCPSYRVTRLESLGARGRMAAAGAIDLGQSDLLSPHLRETITACLLCGACGRECAGGLSADVVVQSLRQETVKAQGMPLVKKLLLEGLPPHGAVPRAASKTMSRVSAWLNQCVPPGIGLRDRFPLPALLNRMYFPAIPRRSFLDAISTSTRDRIIPSTPPPESGKPGPAGFRVALFLGCMANYLLPEVSQATVAILNRSGFTVTIPKNQTCCGLAAWSAGDVARSEALITANLAVFKDIEADYIVSPCDSCTAYLKTAAEHTRHPDALKLAGKVMPLSELLVNIAGLGQTGSAPFPDEARQREDDHLPDLLVTYHDPCHLKNKLKITAAPRRLIASRPHVRLVEPGGQVTCCGHGGLFSVTHPGLSLKISEERIDRIAGTMADAVITGCMACVLQLRDGAARRGNSPLVLHLAEFLQSRI